MENINQDAMMHARPQASGSDTGGPLQIPDERNLMNDDAQDDLARTVANGNLDDARLGQSQGDVVNGGANTAPADVADDAPSGNMVTTNGTHTAASSIGNNDGTGTTPEGSDLDPSGGDGYTSNDLGEPFGDPRPAIDGNG